MSSDEFDAFHRHQSLRSESGQTLVAPGSSAQPVDHKERVTFVRDRLKKLKPKKKDGILHSIEAMFQFSGGIGTNEIEKLLKSLAKEKFLTISSDGKVTYHDVAKAGIPADSASRRC